MQKRVKHKIKITPKLLGKLKLWWSIYKQVEIEYWSHIKDLEDRMAKDTDIDDIEIFFTDNEAVGIGNTSRDMPLIQRNKLE